jgi:hypothetical protein
MPKVSNIKRYNVTLSILRLGQTLEAIAVLLQYRSGLFVVNSNRHSETISKLSHVNFHGDQVVPIVGRP